MTTLKLGSVGAEVVELQKLLNVHNIIVSTDGQFGPKTHQAVCLFQQRNGLKIDGIVGPVTWNVLRQNAVSGGQQGTVNPKMQQGSSSGGLDFAEAARILGVEEAAIRAVHEVECGGRNGFCQEGYPTILFEGHVFWGQLKKRGIEPERFTSGNEDILYPKWDRTKYKGGMAEHQRLSKARRIHNEAALASASWGMFQIMGFNYNHCGYNSILAYVEDMHKCSNTQLLAFINFIKNTGLAVHLRQRDWAGFARKYNGAGYAQNQYDKKLERAYLKYMK